MATRSKELQALIDRCSIQPAAIINDLVKQHTAKFGSPPDCIVLNINMAVAVRMLFPTLTFTQPFVGRSSQLHMKNVNIAFFHLDDRMYRAFADLAVGYTSTPSPYGGYKEGIAQ